jgi:hypothetical protein
VGAPGGKGGDFQSQARTLSLHGCSTSGGTSHWDPIEEEEDSCSVINQTVVLCTGQQDLCHYSVLFLWHVQNATIPCRSQELLPLLPVIHFSCHLCHCISINLQSCPFSTQYRCAPISTGNTFQDQWRTQEIFPGGVLCQEFFSGGGQQIQLRTEGRENGSPLVRGSTRFKLVS